MRTDVGSIAETDLAFTGQRSLDVQGDATIGLLDYHARFYDAALGRFISPDSIVSDAANLQALNRYSYTLNNPIRYNDPSGHRVCDDVDAMGNCITAPGSPAGGLGGTRGRDRRNDDRPPSYTYHLHSDTNLYSLGWQNFGSAWDIYTNPDATTLQRTGAGMYMGAWIDAHVILVSGLALLAYAAIVETATTTAAVCSINIKACIDEAGQAVGELDGLPRVFYSGPGAQGEAEAWAKVNNAIALSQTEAGAELQQIFDTLGYNAMRPYAEAASAGWAEGASGPVHVFLNSPIDYVHGIWATIEYPALLVNDAVTESIPHIGGKYLCEVSYV